MLLFPIVLSLFFLRNGDGEAIVIQQSKVRDPRYFVKSFIGLFEENWKDYDGSGKIFLSREESIIESDKVTDDSHVCSSIVYAENQEFQSQMGVQFKKEIYARQNAYLYGFNTLKAACSKKDLILGSGTQVTRWVDAEGTLIVYDHCNLGVSASSITKIIIGENCRFKRLFAPIILLGITPEEERLLIKNEQVVIPNISIMKQIRNIKYVDDYITEGTKILSKSVVSKYNIKVLNGLIIEGHIRSNKGIRLYDNVTIYGNIFAEKDIHIGQDVRIYGSVFTQGNVFTESGVVIGQYSKPKSLIARGKIVFGKNCCVYGYVSSEAGGECNTDVTKINERYAYQNRI